MSALLFALVLFLCTNHIVVSSHVKCTCSSISIYRTVQVCVVPKLLNGADPILPACRGQGSITYTKNDSDFTR